MFDLTDHQLTTISTWAEVAIILFMVWEKYSPQFGVGPLIQAPNRIGIARFLWDNRTLIVAILGLFFIGWLNWPPAKTTTSLRVTAPSAITPMKFVAVPRNKETGDPFFVNVFVMIESDESLEDVLARGVAMQTRKDLSHDVLDSNFRILNADVAATPNNAAVEYPPKAPRQISVFPDSFNDRAFDAVKNGDSLLYVMAVWQYRLPNSSARYIKEICVFFTETFENIKICPGKHNGTYIEK